MIIPWTIGQVYQDESAALTAVRSCGMVARMQYGIAILVAAHDRFAGDLVPVVIDLVGDYISEMQRLNAATGLYFLVQTPELTWQRATEWQATVNVQAIETPVLNRTKRGGCITALRACEMARAVLDQHVPDEGWTPLWGTRIVRVQSDTSTSSYALVLQTRALLTTESA
jgi:hypothetical protein